MEINRNYNVAKRTESIAAVRAEDVIAASIGENELEGSAKIKPEKLRKKKQASSKSRSVAFINKETDPKELMDQFMEKMQMSKSKSRKETIQKQIQEDIERGFQNKFDSSKAKDTVSISSSVATHAQSQLDKAAKKASLTDDGVISVIDVLSENLEKVQDQNKEASQTKAMAGTDKGVSQPVSKETTVNMEQMVKQYLLAYSEQLVEDNPKKKIEAEQIKQKLLSSGLSTKKLKKLETNIQKMVHGDIKKQVKKGFMKYALSFGAKKFSWDAFKNRDDFNEVSKMAKMAGVFGEGVDGVEDLKTQARKELDVFVADELDKALIKGKLNDSSTKALVKAFDKFNTMANIARFSTEEYFKSLGDKLEDLGLTYFENPEDRGVIDTDEHGSGGQQSSDNKESEIELENVEEELRFVLTQKVVTPKLFGNIGDVLKINKLQKRLLKNGYSQAQIDKIKDEAAGVAKMQLGVVLREGLEERAVLFELKGAAHDLVKKKIKTALKGFKRLGEPIQKKELKSMRDKTNKNLFYVIREEYMKQEVLLEANPGNIFTINKKERYLSILSRLKQESNIEDDYRPKDFQDMHFSADTKIIEAA